MMQDAGYFVLLLFVGLSSAELSVARVITRVAQGGHDVSHEKLLARFPRTQQAICAAKDIADGAILVDNSRDAKSAFSVARVQMKDKEVFDWRNLRASQPPIAVLDWLNVVAPRDSAS